jgi:hypothetical protein
LLQALLLCYGALHRGQSDKCLLIALHTVHFAGWSDVPITLCWFSETQNLMFRFFTNPSGNWLAHYTIGSLRWRDTAIQTVSSGRTHVSAAFRLQRASVPLGFYKDTSNAVARWCLLMLFWYRVTGNIASQILSDSETALRAHWQQCPARPVLSHHTFLVVADITS